MLLRRIRERLARGTSQWPGRRHKAPSRSTKYFCPSIDALEDRRLLTATLTGTEPAQQFAASFALTAEVVGRHIFYNNSRFDGNTPAAGAADDAAIAIDKTALVAGRQATFANYTSYASGINGIMVDIAGLAGVPTAEDFVFRVGNSDDPLRWSTAPAPQSISVRPGAGVEGSTRVTIIWPDSLVRNAWLQVGVRATAQTGLAKPDVFYFGNAIGESSRGLGFGVVDATDQIAARNNPRSISDPVGITVPEDFNRDGLVSPADELIARRFSNAAVGFLRVLSPDARFAIADVVGRSVFYNNSQFDGMNAQSGPADDAAIAPDKVALLPGGRATLTNYTSYQHGLNGVMVDIAGLTQNLTLDDFEFRVGSDSVTSNWAPAPAPSALTVRPGAGVNGAARVTITWPDGAIRQQWLQVTVMVTPRTSLPKADVFYFGNAIGESGDWATDAHVTVMDALRVGVARSAEPAAVDTLFDVNRDRVVDAIDESIVRANFTSGTNSLALLNLAPPAAAASTGETTYADFATVAVVGRYIFYNNSQFDGRNPAAAATDDGAIAVDKSALLPGGTAALANYTSYSRGINGILIDVAGLSGIPTADDFLFRVGNDSQSDGWSAAPQPLGIKVRAGEGVGGSARVTIIWADGAIQKQWLQVTIKATPATGLKRPDVFYFGNAVGESGNSATDARVDSTDQIMARNNNWLLSTSVPITAASDHNRDGLVDSADEWISARSGTPTNPLRLIAAASAEAAPVAERPQIELFNRGDGGINVAFAPNLVRTHQGTLLAIAEGRAGEHDSTSYALILRRSFDGGATWSAISTIYSTAPASGEYIGNPAAVVDATTGEIFLLFCRNSDTVFVTSSTDDGLSWSAPVDITSTVKVTSAGNPNPAAYPSTPWGWYATGPGHGIQIQQGTYAGRLMIGCDHRLTADRSGISWSHVIYSDDHGRTWRLGGGLDQANEFNAYSNEASVVEQSDGGLYMSIRVNNDSPFRGFSRSYDGGTTWTTMARDARLTTFPVEASLLRVNANTVLLSAPDSHDGVRRQMTLWISHDNMQTWTKTKTVFYGLSGYSDMVLAGEDTVLLAYNRGHANGSSFQSIGLARFNLRWLQDTTGYQFTWHFNEELPGTRANTYMPTLQDFSPWDNRAQAQAASPEEAPNYAAGPNGGTALSLTGGSDSVVLTPPSTFAANFETEDSFTIELVMRTTDTSGVILGTRADAKGWAALLVDGHVQFRLVGQQHLLTVTSSVAINDGGWHHIALVRDRTTRLLRTIIDGTTVNVGLDIATNVPRSYEAVRLGAYNDGTGQLAFDVDLLRITRAALSVAQIQQASLAEPARFPAAPRRADGPDTLGGLRLWLPAYDYSRYFADLNYATPVPTAPVFGTVVHSGIDASPNSYRVSVNSANRHVLYDQDAVVGPHWVHDASSAQAGSQWVVRNSNGTSASNFDFVQSTGTFTLSTFVKAAENPDSARALFDTAESSAANSGFTLLLLPNGALMFLIMGLDGTVRFSHTTSAGLIMPGEWVHVAIVGKGPGSPVTFYVTKASRTTVIGYTSSQVVTGENGSYPTNAQHDLAIGSLSKSGLAAFDGGMVDQAIYDRALSTAEIQQLFEYTRRS